MMSGFLCNRRSFLLCTYSAMPLNSPSLCILKTKRLNITCCIRRGRKLSFRDIQNVFLQQYMHFDNGITTCIGESYFFALLAKKSEIALRKFCITCQASLSKTISPENDNVCLRFCLFMEEIDFPRYDSSRIGKNQRGFFMHLLYTIYT